MSATYTFPEAYVEDFHKRHPDPSDRRTVEEKRRSARWHELTRAWYACKTHEGRLAIAARRDRVAV